MENKIKNYMSKVTFRKSYKKGFTLVEMLTVVAIIGILTGVVIVGTQGAKERSKRVSALTTASSVLPELVTCGDDGGFASSAPAAGECICCIAANSCTSSCLSGHTERWPNLVNKTGWDYGSTLGSISNGDYQFTVNRPEGSLLDNINCSMNTSSCE